MTTRNIVPRGNNEGGVGTTSKKWANVWGVLVNALTLSAQTIGFTIAGGTTSKTLTVDETVALSAKAPLTSPALITPNLGTPSAGVLSACTTATAADNTATTALATTAYAKSQDAVLARLPYQAVNIAFSDSLPSIAVSNNTNINFGTGNFTLVFNGSLDWNTTIQYLCSKYITLLGYYLHTWTGSTLRLVLYGASGVGAYVSAAFNLVDKTNHQICVVVNRETVTVDGSVSFYIDGVNSGNNTIIKNTVGNIDQNTPLYCMGTTGGRTTGTCSFAATYNRALTAAEVLNLYRNGISYSDKWGSQVSIFTGTNSDMSGANSWTNSGLATFNVNTTVAGKAYLLGDGDNDSMYILSSSVTIGTYFISLKARLNAGASTTIYAGRYPQPSTLGMTMVEFTPTGTEATYSGIFTILSGYEGAIYIGRAAAIGGFNGVAFEIDDVLVYKLGATLALESENAQPAPGQWLDSSTNALHAIHPATGSSLTRPKTTFEYRWINTWAGTHEAQYITGVNQAVLPTDNIRIESITMRCSATGVNVVLGDGSDVDRFVASVALAMYLDCTIANKNHDGTNKKLVIDPDGNYTGSITTTIKGIILS